MSEEKEEFAGKCIIPSWIMRHPEITPVMAIVYGLIDGLSSSQPYCTAGNDWLVRNYGLSRHQVQHSISALLKLGFIERILDRRPNDKFKTRRCLRVVTLSDARPSDRSDPQSIRWIGSSSSDGSDIDIKEDNNKANMKEEGEGAQLPARVVTLEPSKKKTRFDMKTSIAREGYQELLSRTDLANGDRQWLYSQMESMQDWSINGHLKQDWLATARNWIKRARKSGDMPKGAAPTRHQPKTFKQIDDEEFEKNLEEFRRMKL